MSTITEQSTLTRQQYKNFGPRSVEGYGKGAAIWAHVRYDDECGNGHNSFSITATVREPHKRDISAGGCMHEEIAKAFPELEPFIKWHLMSSDGPMHYIANTLYHAGTKGSDGHEQGEPYRYETYIHFGSNPIAHKFGKRFTRFLMEAKAHPGSERFDFEVIAVDHGRTSDNDYSFAPKYTFGGFDAAWHECPFDTESEALNFLKALQTCDPQFSERPTAWGKGKAWTGARRTAIWPDATDEDLTAPGLQERLEARLPGLLIEFRAAVESLGFTW